MMMSAANLDHKGPQVASSNGQETGINPESVNDGKDGAFKTTEPQVANGTVEANNG